MSIAFPEHPEQDRAAHLLAQYGHSSNDYFKLWPDKDYWFNTAQTGFVAYGVSHHVIVSLGDPIAPDSQMEQTLLEFADFCHQNNWTPLFHQVGPEIIPLYEKLGYRHFKGSQEALVDLTTFTTSGKEHKELRSALNKMQRENITFRLFDTPVPDDMIAQAQVVTDSWLSLGRRERTFTLGRFEEEYVRHTPMMAVFDASGTMQAFANIIPSYAPNTATIDMMRHRKDAPHGVMDFLFLKLFEYNRAEGFHYFSLGSTPIITPDPGEKAALEERAFYQLTNYLDWMFSMRGLRQYKEKFATIWEPRYLVYRHRLDMPRFIQAINDLCELDENKKPLISRASARQIARISTVIIHEIRKHRSIHLRSSNA
jgi:phosphatidylglycerol lysyltransferase